MKTPPQLLAIAFLLGCCMCFAGFRFHGLSADLASLLIESTTESQRKKLCIPFESEKRFDWSYLPAYSVPRNGLALKEMTVGQRELVGQLLAVSLSESGYQKVKLIMSLEEILASLENNSGRDPGLYFVSIFGSPSGEAPWAWQLDGHHLSLHFTVVNGEVAYTPRFLGANPAEVKQGPRQGLRVLNREEDLAFELLRSLTAGQLDKAVFSEGTFTDRDIATKNAAKVDPLQPTGILLKELTAEQQRLLWAIVDEYLSVMPEKDAGKRKSQIAANDPETIRFGWAGSRQLGAPHYYRIQGPTFLIEFDNSQGRGNHIHSVWRDFDGDFGRDLIREHYAQTKH